MTKTQRFTDAGVNIIDAFIGNMPDENPKWLAIKGLWFAIFTAIQVDKALFGGETEQFGKEIQKRTKGRKELLNSPEFQQALLLTIEAHSITRHEKKREYITNVFTERYLSTEDLKDFELERLNNVAQRISIPAMQFLKIIDEKILPVKIKDVKTKVKKTDKLDFLPDEYTHQDIWHKSPLSNYVNDWIKSEYDPSDPRMRKNHKDITDKKSSMPYKEEPLKNQLQVSEFSSELISLGIFQPVSAFDGVGYRISDFGVEFIKYLKGISFEKSIFWN